MHLPSLSSALPSGRRGHSAFSWLILPLSLILLFAQPSGASTYQSLGKGVPAKGGSHRPDPDSVRAVLLEQARRTMKRSGKARDRAAAERAREAYERGRDSALVALQGRRVKGDLKARQRQATSDFSVSQSLSAAAYDQVPDSEELAALQALYNSGYGGWYQNDNWLQGTTSADFATWYGVEVRDGDVVGLDLSFNGVSGGMPLPGALTKLARLEKLFLAGNSFAGNLPAAILNMPSLLWVDLSHNSFTGVIPAITGTQSKLEYLNLSITSLTGPIPASFGNLGRMRWLDLSYTYMQGQIPSSIGALPHLESLDLASSGLQGPIPPSIGGLPNLRWLNLSHNQLSGNIPGALGGMAKLEMLYLRANSLSGPIPATFTGLVGMKWLDLSQNSLTGQIPPGLGDHLRKLEELNLALNALTGPIPSSLGTLPNLYYLVLSHNGLSGNLPHSLGLLHNLYVLVLSGNHLTGPIPPSLGGLEWLNVLGLSDNDLTGHLPPTLNWANMADLDLSGNRLEGDIPQTIGNSPLLMSLVLSDNGFTGALPATLADLGDLYVVWADRNRLTSIPAFPANPVTLGAEVEVYGNRLDFGSLEPNMTGPGQHLLYSFGYIPQDSLLQPRTVEVTPGEPLSLEVVTGGTKNRYQWQRKVGGAWQDIAGATAATYGVGAAAAVDLGPYRLRVTNDWVTGLTLHSHEITVREGGKCPSLTVSVSPASAVAGPGAPVTLSATASSPDGSGASGATFSWTLPTG